MQEMKTTSVSLIIRSQAWFEAFVVVDGLATFDPKWINEFLVPKPNTMEIRTWIGKGPLTHNIRRTGFLYFDHGEEGYPVYSYPSESPKGSSLKVSKINRSVIADENMALFCIEGVRSIPVQPETLDKALNNTMDTESLTFVKSQIEWTKNILDTIIGGYALYQYPLVWRVIDESHQWIVMDYVSHKASRTFEQHTLDNFVPFKLDPKVKVTNGGLNDGVISNGVKLSEADLREPLVLLKDSMWHSDIRTRFLLQFWIIEYFAEKYARGMKEDEEMRQFVEALAQVVEQKFPQHLQRFKQRKGELLRKTLVEKAVACFQTLKIQYDDAIFKRAKKLRDDLSHGNEHDPVGLIEMERYVRELARLMIRRDLELKGVFLDGDFKSPDDLEIVVPSFVKGLGRCQSASAQLS